MTRSSLSWFNSIAHHYNNGWFAHTVFVQVFSIQRCLPLYAAGNRPSLRWADDVIGNITSDHQ